MAKVINGELSGRLRDVVYRRTKEFGVIASEYNATAYKKRTWSESQLYTMAKFKTLAAISASFRKASNLGFESGKKVLSHPSFIKNNYNILIDKDGGGFDVDYSKICMSCGVLPQLEDLQSTVIGRTLELNWKYTPKKYSVAVKKKVKKSLGGDKNGRDRVVVVMYYPDYTNANPYKCEVFEGLAARESCGLKVDVPADFVDNKVYFYAFVVDENKRSSNTQFINEFHELRDNAVNSDITEVELNIAENDIDIPTVFIGVEQRDEEIAGEIKHCFVMRFSVDDEEVEEILAEPLGGEAFKPRIIDGVKHKSQASETVFKMKKLIKAVNPAFYDEKLQRGDDIQFKDWNSLCSMVARAVDGCEGMIVDWQML